MPNVIKILAVNPGSTSTKIALYENSPEQTAASELFNASIEHTPDELKQFGDIQDQLDFRADTVERAVTERGYSLGDTDVFVGRGGGLLSVEGGVYTVDELLMDHASKGMTGQHPAQLASQICGRFAEKYGGAAFVVNPPDVDEFCDLARVSGLKGIYRESHIHALNQKEIALRFCQSRDVKYEDMRLIICHMGGGISITAHENGRMVDSNDIIKGSGPMTPTRAGDLPYVKVIELAYSGEYTKKELTARLNRNGGLTDHFGTSDVREIVKMIERGDKYAKTILDGMIYQNAKYIGAMAAALKGKVDAIILTGGIAYNQYFMPILREYIDWIAELVIMPGEFELEALASGAVRVMRGVETARKYTGVPVWDGF